MPVQAYLQLTDYKGNKAENRVPPGTARAPLLSGNRSPTAGRWTMKRIIQTTALTMSLMALAAFAPAPALAEDQPSEGVARVSVINGAVTVMRGDTGDWVATTVNAPVVRGDQVATGARSRAELQLDHANVLRFDENTVAKIADLTRTRIQIQVSHGVVNYSVLRGSEADVEIGRPNVAVHPVGEGSYRIQVNSNAESEVTVRKGEAEVSTPQGSTTVKKNDMITAQGVENPQYQITAARGRDDLENWSRDRDRQILDARSWSHVNPYYAGAHDLDPYGHWVYVPGYDWVWTPYVGAGWAPYRDGSWVWEPYWGWTWVSYEPWGWAPYHYGRWFFWGGSWCWWPGYVTPFYRPVWAPAFVSFFGFGFGRFNFGFGFDSIGWCPLGPRDPFFPWWGRGRSFNVVNITNITNITNVTNIRNSGHTRIVADSFTGSNLQAALTDPNVRRGITTVNAQEFGSARIVRNTRIVDAGMLRDAKVVNGTLPVVPTARSLTPVDRPAVVPAAARSVAVGNQRFFTMNPSRPVPRPTSFEASAAEIRQMVQNPAAHEAMNPSPAATRGFEQPSRMNNAPAASLGVGARATGEMGGGRNSVEMGRAPRQMPAGVAQNESPPAPAETARPGWRRFGGESPGASEIAPARGARPRFVAPENRGEQAPARPSEVPQSERPGWQRFSRPSPETPRGQAAPREFNRPPEQQNFSPRRAPETAPPSGQPGWNRFTPQPEMTRPSRQEGFGRSYERQPMNFPSSRGERPGYYSAPESSRRPPLNINKPIVTERSPRSYGGEGYSRSAPESRGGGRSAPPSSNRSGHENRH